MYGDIVVYNGGKEWGSYDADTDTIYLNGNIKWQGKTMLAFTLAHELVHRAKAGSPAQYRAFTKFLLEQYGKQGADLNGMIAQQMYAAKQAGRKLTRERALEEVFCDAAMRMLIDTDAGKKLAQWGAQSSQNKSFLEKVKTVLENILNRLRSYFAGVDPDSMAAQEFAKFDENAKQILADMFVDMSRDAGEKLSTIKQAGMLDQLNKNTAQEGGEQQSGGRKYKIPVDTKSPTYEDLVAKDPIAVIDIGHNTKGLTYAKLKDEVKKNAEKRKLFDSPHPNRDTGIYIFLTEASYTHAFSNLTKDFGVDTILAMDHIVEIIREAILTHIADPKDARKAESRVLTFFGAIEGENGVEPIKLQVKEYQDQHIDELPKNIKQYFSESQRVKTHNRLYDAVALEVIAVQKIESGASANVANPSRLGAKGTPNSNIKIADLLALVNGDAKKYIPEKADGKKNKISVSEDISPRELLVQTVEGMVANSKEWEKLQEYRKKIQELNAAEEKVERLGKELKKLYFPEDGAPRNNALIQNLQWQRNEAIKLLIKYDSQLINLENTKPIRAIVERMRQASFREGFQKAKTYYLEKSQQREDNLRQQYQESRRAHIAQAAVSATGGVPIAPPQSACLADSSPRRGAFGGCILEISRAFSDRRRQGCSYR